MLSASRAANARRELRHPLDSRRRLPAPRALGAHHARPAACCMSSRLLLDLQTNSIERHLRGALAGFHGRLLDVGCGNSPFRHLLDPAAAQYQGVDVAAAAAFGYQNPDTVYYDGHVLPFPDASFDAVLCTEVVEHIPDPAETIREIHRVLKPGGLLVVTIPWSARFHYQPYDYHRYTPSMLSSLFKVDSPARWVRARAAPT